MWDLYFRCVIVDLTALLWPRGSSSVLDLRISYFENHEAALMLGWISYFENHLEWGLYSWRTLFQALTRRQSHQPSNHKNLISHHDWSCYGLLLRFEVWYLELYKYWWTSIYWYFARSSLLGYTSHYNSIFIYCWSYIYLYWVCVQIIWGS